MKTCRTCCETKPLTEFSPKRDNRDGLQTVCKPCMNAATKAWYAANKPKALTVQAAWRDANRGRWNASVMAAAKRYQCAKLNRVPPWFDAARAKEVYDFAQEFREAGFEVDVDHITPLQGKVVSGLHWHGNLRVCLATANRSKRNAICPHHGPLAV